jgi:diacylglycerol kinase (ATP)
VSADRHALLLVNPRSRKPPAKSALEEGIDWLSTRGWAVELKATADDAQLCGLAAKAAERGCDCVIACGGDGTLNGALNGVAGSATALALVPSGTANVWAREAGLPSDPMAALRLVAEGARIRLDTGRVGKRAFLLMTSSGLDSLIADRVDWRIKRRFGLFAYLGRALLELRGFRGLEAEIRLDDAVLSGRMLGLVAGNTRSYGGVLAITRQARADDGLLDVCLFKGSSRRRFLLHLADTALGRHLESDEVVYRRARSIQLTTERPWPVQADGEVVAQTPVTIECVPQSVTVVVPADVASPLWGRR